MNVNNNKIEIDQGLSPSLRQPIGNDPSGEALGRGHGLAWPGKQADCMVSQVCCSGCVEVAPYSTGAVLVMETNHREEGQEALEHARARRRWRSLDTATAPYLGPPQAIW